jgi:restriction system protein
VAPWPVVATRVYSSPRVRFTTGTFTADAKKEATRDGAPPIDLIDGDRLCELLQKYDLGVQTKTRTVEDVTIDNAFFSEI